MSTVNMITSNRTLVEKSINAVNGGALVIASQQVYAIRIQNLPGTSRAGRGVDACKHGEMAICSQLASTNLVTHEHDHDFNAHV